VLCATFSDQNFLRFLRFLEITHDSLQVFAQNLADFFSSVQALVRRLIMQLGTTTPFAVRFRGNVRAVLENGLAGRIRVGQHCGVDVDHHLIPFARCAGIEAVVQRGLGEQGQRVGMLLREGRRICGNVHLAGVCVVHPALLIQGLAGCGQGLQDHRARNAICALLRRAGAISRWQSGARDRDHAKLSSVDFSGHRPGAFPLARDGYVCRRSRGSSKSRRPSPRKLIPSTVNRIARPGKTAIHPATVR
jgi:hypothetical protein